MSGGGGAARPRVSVVIPCYNERNRLPPTLADVLCYLRARGEPAEVVVVDDGSSDGTGEWAETQTAADLPVRVIRYSPNRGKGYAVKTGMLAAAGDFVLFMDADGSTPVAEADAVWPLLAAGRADLVIGSRHLEQSTVVASQSRLRALAGELYAGLTRALVLRGVTDTQCGFKAFTRAAAQTLFGELELTCPIFDIELLLLAANHRLRVAEVPVRWRHDGETRLGYNWRRSLWIFGELLKLKARHRVLWPRKVRRVESGGR